MDNRVRYVAAERSNFVDGEMDLLVAFTNGRYQSISVTPQMTPRTVARQLRLMADNIDQDIKVGAL